MPIHIPLRIKKELSRLDVTDNGQLLVDGQPIETGSGGTPVDDNTVSPTNTWSAEKIQQVISSATSGSGIEIYDTPATRPAPINAGKIIYVKSLNEIQLSALDPAGGVIPTFLTTEGDRTSITKNGISISGSQLNNINDKYGRLNNGTRLYNDAVFWASGTTPTFTITLPTAQTLTQYSISSFSDYSGGNFGGMMPKQVWVEARNGSNSWTVISNITDNNAWTQLNETRTYDIQTPGSYDQYKITVTQNNGYATLTGFSEFQISKPAGMVWQTLKIDKNLESLQNQVNSLTNGMTFKGNVATKSLLPASGVKGDTYVVEADETQSNLRTMYVHNGSAFIFVGKFSVETGAKINDGVSNSTTETWSNSKIKAELDLKLSGAHTHVFSDITGLNTLEGRVTSVETDLLGRPTNAQVVDLDNRLDTVEADLLTRPTYAQYISNKNRLDTIDADLLTRPTNAQVVDLDNRLDTLEAIPTHSHSNKATLDKLSDNGTSLLFNGSVVGGSGGSASPKLHIRVGISGTNQSIGTSPTRISFGTLIFDKTTSNSFDTTNKQWVCPKSGQYEVKIRLMIQSVSSGGSLCTMNYKLNATTPFAYKHNFVTNGMLVDTIIMDMAAGDVFYPDFSSGTAGGTISNVVNYTFMDIREI